jgi:hypothetical protein
MRDSTWLAMASLARTRMYNYRRQDMKGWWR